MATSPLQDSAAHEVVLRVADVQAAVTWFASGLGFSRQRADDERAEMTLGTASLMLEVEPDPTTSSVIKIGILARDFEALYQRFVDAYPQDVLVQPSDLPDLDHDGWPSRHFLVRTPSGLLVQVFEGSASSASRWHLAAVSVPSLDEAVDWYRAQAGFEEVARPDYGDPRSLLHNGTFFLEVGEFGTHATAAGTQLRLDLARPASECRQELTPHGFELRSCTRPR